ncbi:MAG: FAD-binding oxidoreductase [Burkholderiaceae bacterium]
MTDQDLIASVRASTDDGCVIEPADAAGRSISPQGHTMPAVPILRPASTEQVAACLRLCAQAGRSLIPLGGGTNYAGSTKPTERREWYLSLERMNRIEQIDTASRVAVVGAGVVLEHLHNAARDHGMQFAVDLGGRGSATIGGMISTNAGGERVLRYGMMREQVIGIEAVLADGRIVDLMDRVVKNNAGYDIKQLFIGTEGTIGVVTRAVLRLRPAPISTQTAMLALPDIRRVAELLNRIEARLGGTLSAFELLWPEFYETMCGGEAPKHRPPVRHDAGGYVLMEAEGGDPATDAERFERALGELFEDGLIDDAAIAQSHAERAAMWLIRNDVRYFAERWKPRASFDISVPIALMPDYVDELRVALDRQFPGALATVFGHAADNNLHIGVRWGDKVLEHYDEVAECVYAGVVARNGSISAEHGIGLDKRASLRRHKQPAALAMMSELKALFDPTGVLNPGKVLP